jgi:HD-GYP domain-containing protein (c-di-GMP phosphodiesterase class II)
VVASLTAGAGGPLAFVHRLWPGGAVVVTAIPLLDRARDRVGVLALFQPGTERPSAAQLAFVEALSGTAAVAIETQRLLEARKALLDAFIRLVAGAIDAKSPYTGGHCERVPELTLMLARAACDAKDGPYADFGLSDEEWEAVQIASWLHDCGKVTTPEYVVDKATKLETIYDRVHEVRMRFEVLKRDAEIACWKRVAEGGDRAAAAAALERERATLDEEFAFVAGCNEGGEFMDPAKVERLHAIARRTWLRTLDDRIGISHEEKARKDRTPAPALPVEEPLLADRPEHVIARTPGDAMPADNSWGFRLQVPEHQYNRGELYNLAIARGTLTEEERYVINHHIVQTIIMLSQLPFPKHLRNVPEIAGGHHEKMDGTGYPKRLHASEMSPVARMMAIADIFEALTAADRPYKKAKKLSEALKIMSFMKRDRHVDPDLFDLFLTSGVFRRYAERFLRPEQIDEVDIAPYLGPVAARAAG